MLDFCSAGCGPSACLTSKTSMSFVKHCVTGGTALCSVVAAQIGQRRTRYGSYAHWCRAIDEVFIRINAETYYPFPGRAFDHKCAGPSGRCQKEAGTEKQLLNFRARPLKRKQTPTGSQPMSSHPIVPAMK